MALTKSLIWQTLQAVNFCHLHNCLHRFIIIIIINIVIIVITIIAIIIIVVINITRPKPAYGRRGLAGSGAKIQMK